MRQLGFRFVVKFLLENLALVTMGVVALIGIFLIFVQDSVELAIVAIAGAFISLAIGLYQDRQKVDTVNETLHKLLSDQPISLRSNFDGEIFELIDGATETLDFLMRYGEPLDGRYGQLEDMLRNNGRVRIIICKPSDQMMELLSLRSSNARRFATSDQMITETKTRIREWSTLAQTYQDKIQIRVANFPPHYLLFVADGKKLSGKGIALLGNFKVEFRRSPSIKINARDHETLFEFFKADFERYWEFAKPVQSEDID